MKYRVRMDLFFESEADARALYTIAQGSAAKATSLKEGSLQQEIAYCDLELCRHEEGLPCQQLEHLEIRKP